MNRFILAFTLLTCSISHGQAVLELACPSGTAVVNPAGTVYDSSTTKYRQWICVDANGNVTIQNAALSGVSGIVSGTGTSGQFAVFNGASSLTGSTSLSDTGTILSFTEPITFPPGTISVQTAGTGSIGMLAGNVPGFSSNGSIFRAFQAPGQVNGVPFSNSVIATNYSGTAPNTCQPNLPANGRCIVFYSGGVNTGAVSGALVGDGVSADCLTGTSIYAPCGVIPTCVLSTAFIGTTTAAPICTFSIPAVNASFALSCTLSLRASSGTSNATFSLSTSAIGNFSVNPNLVAFGTSPAAIVSSQSVLMNTTSVSFNPVPAPTTAVVVKIDTGFSTAPSATTFQVLESSDTASTIGTGSICTVIQR